MKLLVSYVRWSTKEQDKGDSLYRQTALIEDFYSRHSDEFYMNSVHRYIDKGKSGFHQKHKEVGGDFKRMFDNVISGAIPAGSMIILENFDRASRANVDDALEDIRQILRRGVTLRTLGDGGEFYDKKSLSDPYQLIKQILIADRAHAESLRKQELTIKNWRKKTLDAINDKKPMGKQTPGWIELNADGTGFIVNPRKARIVRHIFALRASGISMFAICKRLNQKGIKTINDRKVRISKTHKPEGGGWSAVSVKSLLKARSVIGYLPDKISTEDYKTVLRKEIPDYYPRIISDSLFNTVQALLEAGGKGKTSSGEHWLYSNIFRTLIRCKCGLTMTPSGIRQPVYQGTYRCNGTPEGRCEYGAVSRKLLDTQLCDRLLNRLAQLYDNNVDQNKLEEYQRDLTSIESDLGILANAVITRPNITQLLLLMDEKQKEKEALIYMIRQEKTRIESVMDLDLSALDMGTVKGRTAAHVIIKKIVKEIVVNGKGKTVDVYLHNGNVIEGFMLTGESDHTSTLLNATDNKNIQDEIALFGKTMVTVFPGQDIKETRALTNYTGWPVAEEPDYPNEQGAENE